MLFERLNCQDLCSKQIIYLRHLKAVTIIYIGSLTGAITQQPAAIMAD